MGHLGIVEAFGRYGATLRNPQWSVSAWAPDGSLVVSLWDHHYRNRDRLQLAFATEAELEGLEQPLPGPSTGAVRHRLQNWNILVISQTIGESRESLPVLLGNVVETGQCWVTSAVAAIDSHTGLVRTANSSYGVVGRRNPTPDSHLLMHICIWLNDRGVGPYYGVPAFFY